MAETLDYKVNIDTTNVADQLSTIKNQVDQAMATFSFRSSIPDPQPTTFNLPTPQGFNSSEVISNAMGSAQADARSFMDSSRLGFHKFMVDAQTFALQTPIGAPPQQQLDPGLRYMPQFSGSPAEGIIKGVTGMGYDPRMSVTSGEYSRRALESSGKNLPSFVGTTLDAVSLGATVLAIGSALMPGTAAAMTAAAATTLAAPAGIAALGFDAYMATAGHDVQPVLNMSAFARDTSWRNLSGKFTGAQAAEVGLAAGRLHRSDIMMGDRMGLGDVERIMKEVTDTGGFDFVRSATDYSDKLKTKVESVRKVMHLLHQTETEAIQTMTTWDKMSIAGTTNQTLGAAMTVASQAYAAGYTSNEFMQFAGQASEMVRGTGVSMQAVYLGSMEALASVKRMAREGTLNQQEVEQLGGFETIANTVVRKGVQWGLSDSGLTYFAAKDYYGNGFNKFSNPYELLQGAIAKTSTLAEYMEARGGLSDRVKEETPENMFQMQTNAFLQEFKMTYGNANVPLTKNTWRSFMERKGEDVVSADLRLDMFQNLITNPSTGFAEQRTAQNIAMYGSRSVWDTGVDIVQRGLSSMFGTEETARNWSNMSRGFDKFGNSVNATMKDFFFGEKIVPNYTAPVHAFTPDYEAEDVTNKKGMLSLAERLNNALAEAPVIQKGKETATVPQGTTGTPAGVTTTKRGDVSVVPAVYLVQGMESRNGETNLLSGFTGVGQFAPATLHDMLRQHEPELLKKYNVPTNPNEWKTTSQSYKDLAGDRDVATRMMGHYIDFIQDQIGTDDSSAVYAGYWLGPDRAKRLLDPKTTDDQRLDSIFTSRRDKDMFVKNKELADLTVGEYWDLVDKKIGQSEKRYAKNHPEFVEEQRRARASANPELVTSEIASLLKITTEAATQLQKQVGFVSVSDALSPEELAKVPEEHKTKTIAELKALVAPAVIATIPVKVVTAEEKKAQEDRLIASSPELQLTAIAKLLSIEDKVAKTLQGSADKLLVSDVVENAPEAFKGKTIAEVKALVAPEVLTAAIAKEKKAFRAGLVTEANQSLQTTNEENIKWMAGELKAWSQKATGGNMFLVKLLDQYSDKDSGSDARKLLENLDKPVREIVTPENLALINAAFKADIVKLPVANQLITARQAIAFANKKVGSKEVEAYAFDLGYEENRGDNGWNAFKEAQKSFARAEDASPEDYSSPTEHNLIGGGGMHRWAYAAGSGKNLLGPAKSARIAVTQSALLGGNVQQLKTARDEYSEKTMLDIFKGSAIEGGMNESSAQEFFKVMAMSEVDAKKELFQKFKASDTYAALKLTDKDLEAEVNKHYSTWRNSETVRKNLERENNRAILYGIQNDTQVATMAYSITHPEAGDLKDISESAVKTWQKNVQAESQRWTPEMVERIAQSSTGALNLGGTWYGAKADEFTALTQSAISKVGFAKQATAAWGEYFKNLETKDKDGKIKPGDTQEARDGLQATIASATVDTAKYTKIIAERGGRITDPRPDGGIDGSKS